MVSIKLPTVLFFVKIDKLMIKSTWKCVKKKSRKAKTVLKGMIKFGQTLELTIEL